MNETNLQTETFPKKEKISISFKNGKYATGRRKKSVARVWIVKGSGNIFVNGKKINEYFKRPRHQMVVSSPLAHVKRDTSYDVRCSVKGGGHSGQVGAMLHGISKALLQFDSSLYQLH